jgi:ABC-type nitrate/sulfonate/bicarbonate transport system substrate-binding protein
MKAKMSRRAALAGLGTALVLPALHTARAADKLRVGKAVAEVYGYIPLDVGMQHGIFAKHGVEIEEIIFAGGTKMAQAVVAGAVDFSLSSGPEMQLIAKGAPEIAVATICKGKKIGITSTGSLTEWLVMALNLSQGWSGADAAIAVAVGGSPTAAFAALKTGAIDADVGGTSTGYQLEETKAGRLLIDCSTYVKSIELFTIFATNAIAEQNPDAVRRFLKGWFESVAFMKAHRAETTPIAAKTTGYTTGVAERMYDTLMAKFSTNGRFDKQALATLRESWTDMKTVDPSIEIAKLYTEKFLS